MSKWVATSALAALAAFGIWNLAKPPRRVKKHPLNLNTWEYAAVWDVFIGLVGLAYLWLL